MTAEVLAFPGARASVAPSAPPRLTVGDIVVLCMETPFGRHWCAWPVAAVDDDGVVIGVHTDAGRLLGADRVCCDPQVYGFAAADHDPEGFAALRWKTWREAGSALFAFARIGRAVTS